jgi:hypothetical protein
MKKPYKYIVSELSRKLKITDVPLEKRSDGMRELFAKDAQAFFTDGQAVLSNLPIAKTKTFFLTEVPPDANGRVDRHPHIAQNVDFENGVKISNTHLASNQNAYMQLDEIIRENNDSERLIIGDINLTHEHMQEHKKGWGDRFIDSTEFLNYISFPDDNVAYDHLLLPKGSRFISVRTVDGLSDHSAVVFEIKEKN